MNLHYSKDGKAYQELSSLLDKISLDKAKDNLQSRLFLFKEVVSIYNNGETFVEFGCGKGQNIFPLSEKFSISQIYGYDISPDSLSYINKYVKKNNIKNIKCKLGDLKNIDFLKNFEDKEFDHVILVNVFSLIFDKNADLSNKMRREVILNLIRISKKSLTIIDSEAIINSGNSFLKIEQLNRAIYYDNILKYFSDLKVLDFINIVYTDNCYAVIYKRKSP